MVNASFSPVQLTFESGVAVQMVLILCKAPIKAGDEVLISYGEEYERTRNRVQVEPVVGFSEDIEESKVFETLDVITSFPQQKHFKNISQKLTDSKYKDHEEIIKSWIVSQDKINLDNKIKFFKTHNFACKKYDENEKKKLQLHRLK